MNLLSIDVNDTLDIFGIENNTLSRFVCLDIIEYENNYNHRSNRYRLFDTDNNKSYILDVSKNYYLDIELTLKEFVEEMVFDLNFFSLLGTSPLAYSHPDINNIEHILYKYRKNPILNYESIKYIVDKSELPKNYKKYGYYQDGDENWYFLTKKYEPNMIKFGNEYRYEWEYQQDDDERLVIDIKTYPSLYDYIDKKPNFMIYTGRKLHRKSIKSINKEHIEIFG